jgi:hypothetical protein
MALSALMLAGCADGYDKAAVPDASVALVKAYDGCQTRFAAHDIKTYSEMAICGLAARRAYFTAVKLQNMDRFEAYAANYQTLAADRDANRVSDSQAQRRANKILSEFYTGCRCKKPDNGPVILGLDTAGTQYGMPVPPPPPPPIR